MSNKILRAAYLKIPFRLDDQPVRLAVAVSDLDGAGANAEFVCRGIDAAIILRSDLKSELQYKAFHEATHFADWLRMIIREPAKMTEAYSYIAESVAYDAVSFFLAKNNDVDAVAYVKDLCAGTELPVCARTAPQARAIYCAPLLARSINYAGLLNLDGAATAELERYSTEASEIRARFKSNNDPVVTAYRKSLLTRALRSAMQSIVTSTLINADLYAAYYCRPYDAYVADAYALTREGIRTALMSKPAYDELMLAVEAQARKYNRPCTYLASGEKISSFVVMRDGDITLFHRYSPLRLASSDTTSRVLKAGDEMQHTVLRAHTPMTVEMTAIPVIGLSGMGAETALKNNGVRTWIRGDSMGSRRDPLFDSEWNYDPWYIWCKMLQLCEKESNAIVTFTGGYQVASIGLLPYPKTIYLVTNFSELVQRKQTWREQHKIELLTDSQIEELRIDFDAYLHYLDRISALRAIVRIDANCTAEQLRKRILEVANT